MLLMSVMSTKSVPQSDDDLFLSICRNDDDIRCFYQYIDQKHNGRMNTKVQIQPYRRYYKQSCKRARQYNSLYTPAANQNCDECKNALQIDRL